MKPANMTIHPPASADHVHPVVSLSVPFPTALLEKLLETGRTHEMCELFWIATERRPDLATCVLHEDSRARIQSFVSTASESVEAEIFLSTYYSTLAYFHETCSIPTATQPWQQVLLPCKITSLDASDKLYNFASLVPGYKGAVFRDYPANDPKLPYYCSWCFNRREGTNVALSRCNRCQAKRYCDAKCQRADWDAGHKQVCKAVVNQ